MFCGTVVWECVHNKVLPNRCRSPAWAWAGLSFPAMRQDGRGGHRGQDPAPCCPMWPSCPRAAGQRKHRPRREETRRLPGWPLNPLFSSSLRGSLASLTRTPPHPLQVPELLSPGSSHGTRMSPEGRVRVGLEHRARLSHCSQGRRGPF